MFNWSNKLPYFINITLCRKTNSFAPFAVQFRKMVSGTSQEIAGKKGQVNFLQRRSPVTGKYDWIEEPEDYDFHQEIARSAYADMLHDHDRNMKYYEAIKIAVNEMHAKGREAIVLDIGTGTGLLSMMAAKSGADKIFACEAFDPMLNCAKQVVTRNQFKDRIQLIAKRSTELKIGVDLPQRANILVTEVFDTELIGEGAISTYNHAIEHLLTDDCIVVPASATVFAQVVDCPLVEEWNFLKEMKIGNSQLQFPPSIKDCYGVPSVQDAQISEINPNQFAPLSEPLEIFEFKWNQKSLNYRAASTEFKSKGSKEHRTNAVFFWWDLKMDQEGKHVISCKPKWAKGPDFAWRDHWMQAIYYLNQSILLNPNESAHLISKHDEFSFWFNIKKNGEPGLIDDEVKGDQVRPVCTCGFHTILSRGRIGMLNDQSRNDKFQRVLGKAIKPDESICLCISECSLLPFIAAKLGAKKVYILETNPSSIEIVQQLIKYNNLEDKIEIVRKSAEGVQPRDFKDLKIDIVFGDPYFNSSVFPWDNLLFWYSIEYLRWSLSDQVQIIPQKAQINGVAVNFEHLWKIKAPVGQVCEGDFDLKNFDDLICNSTTIADSLIDAQPLWEYPGKALSETFNLCNFNFRESPISKGKSVQKFNVKCSGQNLNGIAIWIDWILSDEDMISTGPISPIQEGREINWDIHSKQGVSLFWDKHLKLENSFESEFDWDQGELKLRSCDNFNVV